MRSHDAVLPAEVVVVTGVGGLAMACARRLAPGRRLVLASRTETRLKHAADTLREEGHEVHDLRTDISDPRAVAELAACAAAVGTLRAVVHTAGVSPVQATLEQIVSIDLQGTAFLLDAFLDHAVPGTAVVCISSSAGSMVPLPPELEHALATTPSVQLAQLPVFTPGAIEPGPAYALAKRANQLRVEAASVPYGRKGARVVSVSPGVICTRMGRAELDGPTGARMQAFVASSGLGRLGTPEEVAATVDFLTQPGASYITGVDVRVDGGMVAAARLAAGQQ